MYIGYLDGFLLFALIKFVPFQNSKTEKKKQNVEIIVYFKIIEHRLF